MPRKRRDLARGEAANPTEQPAEGFVLDDHIPYLVNRLAMLSVRAFSQELKEEDLTVPMWRVLAVLREKGPQRQIDLVGLTSIEQSGLSRLIGALCQRGLVNRERSATSNREVTVEITPKGLQFTNRFIQVARRFEAKQVEGLTDSQLAVLRASLHVMFENLWNGPA